MEMDGQSKVLICQNLSQFTSYDEQDYFLSPRQILETISEESSGDEESSYGNWSYHDRYEDSSDSEDFEQEDCLSERNYACPVKRARHDDFFCEFANKGGSNPQLKRHKLLFNLHGEGEPKGADGASINSLNRIRLDELPPLSDVENVSFNSLSRSSSLIQFESLERQIKNEQSGVGSLSSGSSFPTLSNSSFDSGFSGSALKRFGSFDGLQKVQLRRSSGVLKSYAVEKSAVETLSQDSGYCDCEVADKKTAVADHNQNDQLDDITRMRALTRSSSAGDVHHCLSNEIITKIDNDENCFECALEQTEADCQRSRSRGSASEQQRVRPLRLRRSSESESEYQYEHDDCECDDCGSGSGSGYGCDMYEDINSQLTSVALLPSSESDRAVGAAAAASSAGAAAGRSNCSTSDLVSVLPFQRSLVDIADAVEILSNGIASARKHTYRAFTISLPDVRVRNSDPLNKTFSTYAERSVSDPTDLDRIVSSEITHSSAAIYNSNSNSDSGSTSNLKKAPSLPLEFDAIMSAYADTPQRDAPSGGIIRNAYPKRITFDQDPTNLQTSYATSLERCDFDPSERSPAVVRNPYKLVASTPDLRSLSANGKHNSSYLSMQLIPSVAPAQKLSSASINHEQSTEHKSKNKPKSKSKSTTEEFQPSNPRVAEMENAYSTCGTAAAPHAAAPVQPVEQHILVTTKPPAGPSKVAAAAAASGKNKYRNEDHKGFLARVGSYIRFPLRRKKLSKAGSGQSVTSAATGGSGGGCDGYTPKPTPVVSTTATTASGSAPRIVELCEKVRAGPHAPPSFPISENSYTKTSNSNQFGRGKQQFNPIMIENGSAGRPVHRNSMDTHHKIGLIETNLDTHETIVSGKTKSLMELGPPARYQPKKYVANNRIAETDLSEAHAKGKYIEPGNGGANRAHKSMEFLLDKENQMDIMPPENGLQKSHDPSTALSEHQLRVQASLQRLNVPDWYRQYNTQATNKQPFEKSSKTSSYSRKRTSDADRWTTALNTKATSLNSLGCQKLEHTLLLSPSAQSHQGERTNYDGDSSGGFSRWSTSYLNSTQTSPSVSTRASFSRRGPVNSSFMSIGGTTIRSSFRQPYMGWRSQEKLSQPRTPHERLASTMKIAPPVHAAVTPEIQTSIKEVTSEIVHYVNNQASETVRSSRSPSPNTRKFWVESSFVGIRPTDSPQTPVIANSPNFNILNQSKRIRDPVDTVNGVVSERSTSSTSLQDVLSSLLGLATTSKPDADTYRSPENLVKKDSFAFANTSIHLQVEETRYRRRSEGDTPNQHQHHSQPQPQEPSTSHSKNTLPVPDRAPRRISLDSCESNKASDIARCRNPKCTNAATAADAKKYYKSCHNCSNLYCSRECRRAHWEKHRRACLHSRVSNLCRQVLSTCKDDAPSLRHLSLVARKGYLSQGRGVVRILFRSPENAEAFIKCGIQHLGDTSFVRWPDLMPSEMGLELYSELLRLSTEYKPASKMLIYVAICVVSEAPGTTAVPVKWERQLVSRCAKLKLCKSTVAEFEQFKNAASETTSEIVILTFNCQTVCTQSQREGLLANVEDYLTQRGVVLKSLFPEVYQRIHNFIEGVTDKFIPVTIHPRDSRTGQEFVCIIFGVQSESDVYSFPKSDVENNVTVMDVGDGYQKS